MHATLIRSLFFSSMVLGCSPKAKEPERYQSPTQAADAVPKISTEPSKIDGGLTPYKASDMPPEEIARRKSKNEVAPVIFGMSAGGISMQTTVTQADEILTPPLGLTPRRFFDVSLSKDLGLSLGGYLIYAERIGVLWSDSRAMTPAVLRVLSGQPGKLSLVDPVGQIFVGDSLTRVFGPNPSEDLLRQYLRKLGAAIEKRASDYDCELAKTCRLSYLDANEKSVIDLEYRKAYLRLLRDGTDIRLVEAVFHKDFVLPARLKDKLDYEQKTIGPLSASSTRPEIEARLGAPLAEDVFGLLYDRGSLVLRKESAPTPGKVKLRALVGYQGALDLGVSLGSHFLGDSFAPLAPPEDDGLQLMLLLDRALEKREPGFDCRTPPAQCEAYLEFDPFYNMNLIVMDLPKAQFRFSLGAERIWMAYEPK